MEKEAGSKDDVTEIKVDGGVTSLDVTHALLRADRYAFNMQHENGHWCGEFATGAFPTAEYVLFSQACGIDISKDAAAFRKHVLSLQLPNGSWSLAPDHPGDVSMSAEAYLALRLLGLTPESKELQLARSFILGAGGIAKVRVLTRIFLAQFGLVPWDAVPQLPAELMLLPANSPVSIYTIWVAARLSVVPLLIIRHHEPVYALPNGTSSSNDFLDELWLDPKTKTTPYGKSYMELLKKDSLGLIFKAVDHLMYAFKRFRNTPLRYIARKKIVKWMLERQNADGSWFGYATGYQFAMQALLLEGFTTQDAPICRGLSTMQSWMWEDEDGKRVQLSNSPVWDTAMMVKALCSEGSYRNDERVHSAASWLKSHQLFGPHTDLAQYIPDLPDGGFSFEYDNPWYPDVDDSAAVALSLLDQDPNAFEKFPLIRATEFILAMQNVDGGWSAFDRDSNPVWLHKSPFNDMDNLCDPSTADVTGRVLELCGLVIQHANAAAGRPPPDLIVKARRAASRAIPLLASQQEADGSWWGRWGINYVFGTCNAISGLALFAEMERNGSITAMIKRGAAFLARVQHVDGGWGESYATYDMPPAQPGSGPSLPSPTAWAILGLLAAGTACDDRTVSSGIHWLLSEQTLGDGEGGLTWIERPHTGVGFPRKLYIGYKMYQNYFPMLALRRYTSVAAAQKVGDGRQVFQD